MRAAQVWLAIALVTATVLITRTALLFVGGTFTLGPRLTAALRFAPACALTAVICPDLLLENGVLVPLGANPRLLAAVIATVVCILTRGTLATIAVGMAAFWLLRALL